VTTDFTTSDHLDRARSEPFEAGVVQWTRRPGEGGRGDYCSGFWFITPEDAPEPMHVVGHADETIYIIEGHLRVEPEGGEAFELTAGSTASLNKGVPAVWTVLAPTVEFFVYS